MADDHGLDLTFAFSRLQSVVLATTGVTSLLEQMTRVAAAVTDRPMSCAITVRRDGLPLTIASSDALAGSLDESQYSQGEGPCLHALDTGETVLMADVANDVRWPRYQRLARAQGLEASLSLPLGVDETTAGAMNIYSLQSGAFTADVQRRCDLFAAQAAGALQLGLGRIDASAVREQVEEALSSRTVIDQAIGVLVGQQRCTADEAFTLLRQRSQSSHTRIRDVAAELITRVTGQSPQPGRAFDFD